MKLFWTSRAERDRENIVLFIAEDDPLAAVRVDETIGGAALRLASHPRLGRPGRVTGTRELVVHDHYVMVYEIDGTSLTILAVLHTSRQWP